MIQEVIHKYVLEDTLIQTIKMPYSADVISAGFQGETICIWAVHTVDTPQPPEDRTFLVVGTGVKYDAENMRDRCRIATIQKDGLVYHIFEVENYQA